MNFSITRTCSIKNHTVCLNGTPVFSTKESLTLNDFAKETYKWLEMDYPKFYKMDPLCKMSILGAELLLKNTKPDPNTALLFCNRSSCIDIDVKHLASIQEDTRGARPANFVYTLPNIALGEVSIKYGFKSENSFFIFDDFKPDFICAYAGHLLTSNTCKKLLVAWLEIHENQHNCFHFLIEAKEGIALNEENLATLK
jgi:hypothetical protein